MDSHSSTEAQKSIVVLPFVNMSTDPENEFFSDGITEEIINALTLINGLKVIARTSSFAYKGKQVDVRQIGNELGVSNILEGSVRKAGNRIRVTAQPINSTDGTHLWAKNFDRELSDIFVLQDEISHLIAENIRENFGHFNIQDHLVKESTNSFDAYELFLKGRSYQLQWQPEAINKAIELYTKATKIDPRFARAYYGNLQCYGLLAAWGYMNYEEGMQKAIENFMVGQDIDKQLPEYHQSHIGRFFWGEWNYQEAYSQIKETLKLNPNYGDAIEAMAELLLCLGYFDEAEKHIQHGLNIDPHSGNHHYTLGYIYFLRKEFNVALKHIERSILLNPALDLAQHLKAKCAIFLNNKKAFKEATKNSPLKHLQELLFNSVNDKQFTLPQSYLQEWANVAEDRNQLVPYELYILANSGHPEEALTLLKTYIDQRRGQIINYRVDPYLERLRSFHGFDQLFPVNFNPDFSTPQKKEKGLSQSEIDELSETLHAYINQNDAFLDTQLSLTSLAESLEIHPNKLSYVINSKLNKNFNEFINSYRLEHFKQIAHKPEYKHLSVLGLAFESGFNSKSVFNTFFKRSEGVTPSQWIKNVQA